MATTALSIRTLAASVSTVLVLLVLAGCGEVEDAEAVETELGQVAFPTSCSDDVQPQLEQGLALIHHMMYAQAHDVFQEAVAAEEACAMGHWGVAMSRFQPFWGSAQVEEGRGPAERAVALEAPTERERAYARAALAFFQGEDLSHVERVRNWEAAMEELHQAFPEDPEAVSLYALAHLSVDPADRDRQARSHRLLQEVLEDMPRHPGGIHYSIHVHDVEHRAEDGVEFADAYEEIAPKVPHALHMPSHIYVRLGKWDEVIDWNRRSADAALEHPAGEYISHHYPHALDYLMYGYLQQARDEEARAVMEELDSREGYQPSFASAYALAAVPARWHVERRDWEGAAQLPVNVPEAFPWSEFPEAEAMTWFARGLGAARTGDLEGARAAVERLEELRDTAHEDRDYYWADHIEMQRQSVAAWLAHGEGRTDEAIQEMRTAAEMAGEIEKHPVTPGDLQPAYELLGDLLADAGRYTEAVEAYEQSLETWPLRYHSLLGAARAAEEAGEEDVATRFYSELAELTEDAAPEREGIREVREIVGMN